MASTLIGKVVEIDKSDNTVRIEAGGGRNKRSFWKPLESLAAFFTGRRKAAKKGEEVTVEVSGGGGCFGPSYVITGIKAKESKKATATVFPAK